MSDQSLRFEGICAASGYPLTQKQNELFRGYVDILLEWNVKINLVSRKDTENIWLAHILHSASILFLEKIPVGARVLDLGSGGGLPGIPMAILREDLQITLLDSIKKKTMVLEDMKTRLGLTNISVKTGRVEELRKEFQGKFDIIVARGVAPLKEIIEWGMPLLRSRPQTAAPVDAAELRLPAILALKGGDLEKELQAANLGRKGISILARSLAIPGAEELEAEEKKLVIVQKNK